MAKSYWFAVMLAVICLSVILSLEADAQSTVDDSTSLDEVVNMVKMIASNQQQNAEEMRDLKRLLVSVSEQNNETSLETVVKEIKNELQVVKRLLESNQTNCEHVTVKPTVNPTQSTTAEPITVNPTTEYVTVEPSKQALVSALVSDAHPVTPWSAATLEVRIVPSSMSEEGNWQNNGTCSLQDVLNTIASNQQQNAEEIRELKEEMRDLKRLLTSNQTNCEHVTVKPTVNPTQSTTAEPITVNPTTEYVTVEPSKQQLVSALRFNCTPLLIQQHFNGSYFFDRSWAEFKVGFGDPSGNYWLGNDLLSQLTADNRYKLRFDLQSRSNGSWYYAEYRRFRVLTEALNYKLLVAEYSGNASYDALGHHNGMKFSTYDRDNDRHSADCAVWRGGGFWYNRCDHCSVNGNSDYFYWWALPGGRHLHTSRMWLECK